MTAASFTQVTFRIRNDDGNETTATWVATQGTNARLNKDQNYRLRFRIDETASQSWTNKVWNLRYSLNAAAYVAVTGSTPVQFSASSQFADGDDTTTQLTGGTGTFVTNNNGMKETTGGATNSGSAGNLFETEICIKFDSAQVADTDSFAFRIYDGTSALAAYTATPTITIQRTINAAAGSYTLTGAAATLSQGYNPQAAPGAYTLTGAAATLTEQKNVNAAAGSYALSGAAATLSQGYNPQAQPGVYTLSGAAAALTFAPASDADGWSRSLSHSDITLSNDNKTATSKTTGTSEARVALSNVKKTSGKYYVEATSASVGGLPAGHMAIGLAEDGQENDVWLGESLTVTSYGFSADGHFWHNNNDAGPGSAYEYHAHGDGAVVGMAVDLDNGRIWFRDAKGWLTGDPISGAWPLLEFTPSAAGYRIGCVLYDGEAPTVGDSTVNIGNAAFQYPVPFGFKSWDESTTGADQDETAADGLDEERIAGDLTLSGGNLSVARDVANAPGYRNAYSNKVKTSGKWYAETTAVAIGDFPGAFSAIGLARDGYVLAHFIGFDADTYGYFSDGQIYPSGPVVVPEYFAGDILGIAVDLDAGKLWFRSPSGWLDGGDPATGSIPSHEFTPHSDGYRVGVTLYDATLPDEVAVNFGPTVFAYPVPNGFLAWDTQDAVIAEVVEGISGGGGSGDPGEYAWVSRWWELLDEQNKRLEAAERAEERARKDAEEARAKAADAEKRAAKAKGAVAAKARRQAVERRHDVAEAEAEIAEAQALQEAIEARIDALQEKIEAAAFTRRRNTAIALTLLAI